MESQDWKFVQIDGETFVEWEPRLTREEELELDYEVDKLKRYNSVLHALREELGLTQEQFAELLGVTQSNVSKLEKKQEPRLSVVRRLVEHKGGVLRLVAEFDGRLMELPISLVAPVHPSKGRSASSKVSQLAMKRKARSQA